MSADPQPAGESPDKPQMSKGDELDSESMEAAKRALEAFQKAMLNKNAEQTEAAALQMFQLAIEHAEKNPTPELKLGEEARECEARGDWSGAEAIYRKLLAMAESSVPAAPWEYGHIFKVHQELCSLFLLKGEYDKARECAAAATEAARKADMWPLLFRALESDVRCALRVGDLPSAMAAAEALRIVEPGAFHDSQRARALVLRSRCQVAAGDLDLAEQDLAASQPLVFAKGISAIFAGLHSLAAGWWEVRANLCERRGNWSEASEGWGRAVECRRHVASLPHVQGPHTLAALAGALLRLGGALRETGDGTEAERAQAEGWKIWHQLGLPAQAAW